MAYSPSPSREFFESVRDAARDAERCRRQLELAEDRELSLPSSDPSTIHVRGGRGDRVGDSATGYADVESKLHRRIEDDYRLIDRACEILYGSDNEAGLASIAPPWWADAIYHHYVAGRTVPETAALVVYSPRHVNGCIRAAFELMDANGMAATIEGEGMAE